MYKMKEYVLVWIGVCLLQGAVTQEIIMRVKIGSQTTLPCRVPESDVSGTQVKWYRGETWLSSGTYILVDKTRLRINKPFDNEWNLIIKNIDRAFEGVYKCVVQGNTRKQIRVVVETKPEINEDQSSERAINVPEGRSTTIECVVNGEPTPDIKWYREIPGNSEGEVFTKVTGKSITLPNTSRYSDGVYTCVATNRHGEARRTFTVKVNFQPEVFVLAPTIATATHSRVVMMCAIQGQPLFRTYWMDNRGQPISSNFKFDVLTEDVPAYRSRFLTLVFRQAMWTADDLGTYTCYAEGDGASKTATVLLKTAD